MWLNWENKIDNWASLDVVKYTIGAQIAGF